MGRGKVLLGYACKLAWGYVGADGGWSFDLFGNGKLYLRKLRISRNDSTDDVSNEKVIDVSQEAVRELRAYLARNAASIKNLPSKTYNGSLDGGFDIFTFGGKITESLNIYRHPPEHFLRVSKLTNAAIEDNIKFLQAENEILDLFQGAYEILKKYHLGLNMTEDYFSCWWKSEEFDSRT